MQLKSLMVDSKAVWVEYPGLRGFEVEVANLSRKELTALRKKCIVTKFVRRQPEESLDEEMFVEMFTEATLKNWKGLTLAHLENLVLINVDGQDLSKELPFNQENALMLVTQSSEFDQWLNEVVFDLDNFRSKRDRKDVGDAGQIPEKS